MIFIKSTNCFMVCLMLIKIFYALKWPAAPLNLKIMRLAPVLYVFKTPGLNVSETLNGISHVKRKKETFRDIIHVSQMHALQFVTILQLRYSLLYIAQIIWCSKIMILSYLYLHLCTFI
jgi:hypothetical protein